jgi:hypothetical protein
MAQSEKMRITFRTVTDRSFYNVWHCCGVYAVNRRRHIHIHMVLLLFFPFKTKTSDHRHTDETRTFTAYAAPVSR